MACCQVNCAPATRTVARIRAKVIRAVRYSWSFHRPDRSDKLIATTSSGSRRTVASAVRSTGPGCTRAFRPTPGGSTRCWSRSHRTSARNCAPSLRTTTPPQCQRLQQRELPCQNKPFASCLPYVLPYMCVPSKSTVCVKPIDCHRIMREFFLDSMQRAITNDQYPRTVSEQNSRRKKLYVVEI